MKPRSNENRQLDMMLKTNKMRLGGDDSHNIRDVATMIRTYQKNPLLYMKEQLNVGYIQPKMQKIINHVVDNKFTFVRSGHGVGKSFNCAGLVPWYLETHPQALVYTTAPTQRQVNDIIWKEVYKHKQNAMYPIDGDMLTARIKIQEDWMAKGFSSNDGVAYQGRHAKYLFWIIDEADGLDGEIWDAILSTMTGDYNRLIAIGNPINPNSRFRTLQEKYPDSTFEITSFESPNILSCSTDVLDADGVEYENDEKIVVHEGLAYKDDVVAQGCATLSFIKGWIDEFGFDSNEFKSRVLALYPEGGASAIVTRQQVLDCSKIAPIIRKWVILGVDPAYEGDDFSAVVALSGNAFYKKMIRMQGLNGEKLKNEVVKFVDEIESETFYNKETGTIEEFKVAAIVYDASSIATAFKEWITKEYSSSDIILRGINFQEKVTPERVKNQLDYAHLMFNKRAEMYFDFRRFVRKTKIFIPASYDIHVEAPNIKYFTNSSGLFQLESKTEIKKRLKKELGRGKSPDTTDACVLAIHGRTLGLYLAGKQQPFYS